VPLQLGLSERRRHAVRSVKQMEAGGCSHRCCCHRCRHADGDAPDLCRAGREAHGRTRQTGCDIDGDAFETGGGLIGETCEPSFGSRASGATRAAPRPALAAAPTVPDCETVGKHMAKIQLVAFNDAK
jgi:hypothetical protein